MLGLASGTGGEQGERQVETMFGLVGLGLHQFAKADDFGMRVEGCGFRRGIDLAFATGDRLDAVRSQELAQLALRQRAGETIDQLPALDQHDGRHRADLERGREFLLLVDIHLGQPEGAAVFAGQLLQDRAERLAGPAPGRPEIDQHRRFE